MEDERGLQESVSSQEKDSGRSTTIHHRHQYQITTHASAIIRWCQVCGITDLLDNHSGIFYKKWTRVHEQEYWDDVPD